MGLLFSLLKSSQSQSRVKGLTSARLMGHLAKYNPKNLLRMGTHKPSTAPPLAARTLFLCAAHTVQQAHLHPARTAAAHTLVSQHAINTLARSQFIHSRRTIGAGGGGGCVLFLSRLQNKITSSLVGSVMLRAVVAHFCAFWNRRSLMRRYYCSVWFSLAQQKQWKSAGNDWCGSAQR